MHALPSTHKDRPGVAQLMFHHVPPGIVTGCLAEPTCMIIHDLVSQETHYFAADRARTAVPRAAQVDDWEGGRSVQEALWLCVLWAGWACEPLRLRR